MSAELVAIGFSAGGLPVIRTILEQLPAEFPLPVVLVAHLPMGQRSEIAAVLGRELPLPVQFAEDKMPLVARRVFVAPPDYHLLLESDHHFALSVDDVVHSVRPSIDVFFESAAEALDGDLIGVLLSGANRDGAQGLATIGRLGGTTIVLHPDEAMIATMPEAALDAIDVDFVARSDELVSLLRASCE